MISKSLFINLSAALLLFVSMVATPAMSQETTDAEKGWEYVLAPYLLFPYMNGDVAIRGIPAKSDVGPSDIFENLDFGAMLYLEMHNSTWAITVDGLYMDLGVDGKTPLTNRNVGIDLKQFGLEAAGLWRFTSWAEIGLGGRLNILDGSLKVEPGQTLPGIDVSNNYTWFDPLVVVRLTVPLENAWRLGIRGDVGGFGIGSDYAWQVVPFVGYRFKDFFELAGGYRGLGMKYDTVDSGEAFVYDMIISGPEIALIFHF
jgi:hypothetical protein